MKIKKLVKLNKREYAYFQNGVMAKRGILSIVRMWMEREGLRDIDLALRIMSKTGDDVADFGIFGGFTITQKFEDVDLGFNKIAV